MRYATAILLALAAPLASQAEAVSLETAMDGLYPVAAGQCDIEVANSNLKLNQEPCDLARREGDDEHVYLLTPDQNGQPKLIIEGRISDGNPDWKVIYRKGQQST